MSKNYEFVQCLCASENDLESSKESDNSDDVSDSHKSTVEIQTDTKKKLTVSIKTKYPSKYITCRDMSRESIAVEALKKTDADKMRRISNQNLKLFSIFPEASLL